MTRKISILSVIISFIVMALWDIYPTLTPATGDTISEATRDFGTAFYVLPYICGIVMGHFFINGHSSTRSISTLWVSAAAMLMRDTLQLATLPGGNAIALIAGAAAGAVWWPQATVKPVTNIQDNLGGNDADSQE